MIGQRLTKAYTVPMHPELSRSRVVLLGIGHTNAHVLRMWKMQPLANCELVCVSNLPIATYSGMLPGVLAGQYSVDAMQIDLVRLCASAGAKLIVDEVMELSPSHRTLRFRNRTDLNFDALSVGIGSVPSLRHVETHDETLMAIKPMQSFLQRLKARLDVLIPCLPDHRPAKIGVVGAGVGGVEIAFCLPRRLGHWFPHVAFEITLFHAHQSLVHKATPKVQRLVERELQRRSIQVVRGRRVERAQQGQVVLSDGESHALDLAIWATGASAPPLLSRLNLPVDVNGFLRTDSQLQVITGDPIFAVGDAGTIDDTPTAKAGVFAVRQGPVLWRNIPRLLKGLPLETYHPQKGFLSLLNLGDGTAIAQYHGMAFQGKWCWRLKDFIDRRFMEKYQDYAPMPMTPSVGSSTHAMRCAGCGGKVGGSILSRVLDRLNIPQNEHIVVGLDEPDDAAVVRIPGGRPVTVTADFFSAPVDDAYLCGRIAALNAVSDVFAMGARPLAALALITVPLGPQRRQEELLFDCLSGSLREFVPISTSLVGGHTIEGPQFTIGFTILADQGDRRPRTKGALRPGDRLILTKPLGSGILLAAQMRAKCRAEWMQSLLDVMLLSNQGAAELADQFDVTGLTDITGFGLAGHLLEMLRPSGLSAVIDLDRIPLIMGASELIADGVESTLAPSNRDAESRISVDEIGRCRPQYAALFDPQTCGGILLGAAAGDVDAILERLGQQSCVNAAEIGQIVEDQEKCGEIFVRL